MRLVFSLLVGFLFFSYSTIAQKGPAEFGDVSQEELRMQNCKLDSAAQAVILFDKGEIEQFNDGSANFKIHMRIKLFDKEAYNKWGNVSFTVFKSSLSKLKGATYYLENGVVKKTELSSDNIFKKKNGKSFEDISFTFPNLKENAVIEYTYTIKLDSWALPSWSFQNSIPTLWSSYSVNSFVWRYAEDIRGSFRVDEKLTIHTEKSRRWVMTNIPAFKMEPLMPNPGLYKSTIRFWRKGRSWNTICKDLFENESFGGTLTHPKSLRAMAEEITTGIKDPHQKIKAISQYVKNTITWDGTNDYLADYPKVVLEKKIGSSGDINLIFGSLLKQANLNVDMVLLSTRENGLVFEQFPSSGQFNYVVCKVTIDTTSYLFDATEKNLPYNILPPRCLNYDGLVINKDGGEWIKIRPNAKVKESVNADFTLANNGSITGSMKISRDGYDAYSARESYREKGAEEYSKNFGNGKSWQIEKSDIQNIETLEKPFKEEYLIQINDEVTSSGDLMYVNPIIHLKESTNPFVQEKREYPIDFVMPIEKTYVATLKIPDDYNLEELPQSKVIKLPNNDAKSVFSFSQAGNRIFISFNLQINKVLFLKEEYPALREFYTHLVSKMSEQIVLKKKK